MLQQVTYVILLVFDGGSNRLHQLTDIILLLLAGVTLAATGDKLYPARVSCWVTLAAACDRCYPESVCCSVTLAATGDIYYPASASWGNTGGNR